MKKFIGIFIAVCLVVTLFPNLAQADNNKRNYQGYIRAIGYDLKENRLRADVYDKETGQNLGRGQLYFETKAAGHLADLLHIALTKKIEVDMWVEIKDANGRSNVIFTVNFVKLDKKKKKKSKMKLK